MNGRDIFDAFEELNPVLIYMGETRKFRKHTWQKVVCTAAAACLILCAGLWMLRLPSKEPDVVPSPAPTEEQTEVPPETDADLWQEALLTQVSKLEQGVLNFTFSEPSELHADQLFAAYLLLTEPETKEAYLDSEQNQYVFPVQDIQQQLSRYFRDLDVDFTKAAGYDAGKQAVVTDYAQGFGGDRMAKITTQSRNGNIVTWTVSYYSETESADGQSMELELDYSKRYTVELYDGGWYYLSAEPA